MEKTIMAFETHSSIKTFVYSDGALTVPELEFTKTLNTVPSRSILTRQLLFSIWTTPNTRPS